jgi:hypothetical protein
MSAFFVDAMARSDITVEGWVSVNVVSICILDLLARWRSTIATTPNRCLERKEKTHTTQPNNSAPNTHSQASALMFFKFSPKSHFQPDSVRLSPIIMAVAAALLLFSNIH